jgi:CheY-like chemotaxis protein
VVAAAGSARASDPVWATLGAAGVLAQPVTASDLYDALGRHLAQPEDPPTAETAPRPPVAHATAVRTLEVLLAEDNPVNQKLARMLLERAGHRVTLANDGIEAVDTWSTGRFDVVLMDIQMPRLGGFEATARIRSLEIERNGATPGQPPARTPIVALTAHAMIGDEERCLAAGMDAYLSKPLRRERLTEVLDQFSTPEGSGEAAARARGARSAPTLAAVDTAALLNTVGGDQELLSHLCSMFLESLPDLQQRLRSAVDHGHLREVISAAHALRGVISNFHARPSVEALMALERTAAEGDLETLAAGHAHACSEVERAATALREVVTAIA